jgi:hypothetical protein
VARRHATALTQAGSQIPATGMFGHLVQTATLPGGDQERLRGDGQDFLVTCFRISTDQPCQTARPIEPRETME